MSLLSFLPWCIKVVVLMISTLTSTFMPHLWCEWAGAPHVNFCTSLCLCPPWHLCAHPWCPCVALLQFSLWICLSSPSPSGWIPLHSGPFFSALLTTFCFSPLDVSIIQNNILFLILFSSVVSVITSISHLSTFHGHILDVFRQLSGKYKPIFLKNHQPLILKVCSQHFYFPLLLGSKFQWI